MRCSNCKTFLITRFACTVCVDFSLCANCFEKQGHAHGMTDLSLGTMSSESEVCKDQMQPCALESNENSICRFVQDLSHAYRIRDISNTRVSQFIFNHIVETNLECDCSICKQLRSLYTYHNQNCRIPYCCLNTCPIIGEIFNKPLTELNSKPFIQKFMHISPEALKDKLSQPRDLAVKVRNDCLSRKFTIQRCIRMLVHACNCADPNCMPLTCQKMKRILSHAKGCKRKVVGGCPICRQLCTLCCYHAKSCRQSKCSVLLCSSIKRKLKQVGV